MRSKSILFSATRALPCAVLAFLMTTSPVHAAAQSYATAVLVEPAGSPEGHSEVRIRFTSPPHFVAHLDRDGRRLAVDVSASDVRGAPAAVTPKGGIVAGVMTQSFTRNGRGLVRILINLRTKVRYSVAARGTDLVVDLQPGDADAIDAKRAALASTPAPGATLSTVGDIRFERSAQAEQVVVRLSPIPRFHTSARDTKTTIVLEQTHLPVALKRLMDVSAYAGRVTAVASYPDPKHPHRAIIEVEHQAGTTFRADRAGNTLVFEFFVPGALPSSITGIARDGGIARRIRTVSVQSAPTGIPKITTGNEEADEHLTESSTPDARAEAVTPALFGQQQGNRYSGRRIDLDLKDADIHNVLRLLADVGRVNVVTADNVQGTVTIRMRNVPWDQALDVILQAKSLGMVRQANMIRVAPLADLEKERDLAIARAKQEVQLAPVETRLIPVSYASAADVQQRARELLSERGSIAVDERTNVMIVRDVAGNINQIEELTRALDTQTPQVLVEARIVEATSRYLRDVGIQWGGDATFSAATANPTGLAFPNSVGLVGGASDSSTPTAGLSPDVNRVDNPNFAVNLPAAVGTGQGGAIGLTFGSIDNTINLAVRLSAAEASGMLRILSSPRVLTLDNREARIAQGTLIPFSQVSAQGVQTTFQEAKLQLLVRPHVTADGSVSMKVKINRDEPDFNQTSARGDPTILKREAETELLVMDGHTAVIGGIYTRNTGRNLDQVPFFGDIPILGLLFQRRRASDNRGELVIFLTPRIVNRAEALGH